VDSAAKLERIRGPDCETLTGPQVTARAGDLERVTAFVWKVKTAMRLHQAATAGAVLGVAAEEDAG
jgi:hypothetical protein